MSTLPLPFFFRPVLLTGGKTLINLLLLLFMGAVSFAQSSNFYYTFNNKKIYITKINGNYLVEYPNGINTATTSSGGVPSLPGQQLLQNKRYVVSDTSALSSYGNGYYITPAYMTSNARTMYYTKEIVLKFMPYTLPFI